MDPPTPSVESLKKSALSENLVTKCNSARNKNCCSVSLDFDPNNFSLKVVTKNSSESISLTDFPLLEKNFFETDKRGRLALRRQIEGFIRKPGSIEVHDLTVEQQAFRIVIRNAGQKTWFIPGQCGCLRTYLLFRLSTLLADFDSIDTKILATFLGNKRSAKS